MPTTNGPRARPSRLLATVSVPMADARTDECVRLATMAAVGPEDPAEKNAPIPSSTSCAVPVSRRNARARHAREMAQKAIAVVHLRVMSCRPTRSVTIPHTTMPLPTSRTTIEAATPALSGARP